LVVCKELIENMHGKIGMESELGQGCSFWFELPIAEPINSDVTQQIPLQKKINNYSNIYATLLYIEDNPTNIKLMQQLLSLQKGLHLTTVTTAEAGLNIVKIMPPDIIIMDINLPGMSGIEAVKLLKENPETQHIPVLALTAKATQKEINQGAHVGFDNYLTKPISLQHLLDEIHHVLNKTH